jgi:hypothetical protein
VAHEPTGLSALPFAWLVFSKSLLSAVVELPCLEYEQAEHQFDTILRIDPYRIDDIDIFSNILYVQDNKLKLSRLAHDYLTLDKDRPEVCCLVGESVDPSSNRIDI